MTETPTPIPSPNYEDLVAAMSQKRVEVRHTVCLQPSLHNAVSAAKRALNIALLEKQASESGGTAKRQKMGHVSPISAAEEALAEARSIRDAASVTFILSPPTADEEREVIEKQRPVGGKLYEYQVQRVTLLAAWQRTETVEGELLPSLGRETYEKVLYASGKEEIARAHAGLTQALVRPDFS